MIAWPQWGPVADVGAVLIASLSLWRAWRRDARLEGGDRQRIKRLEDERAILASAESVRMLGRRIDDLDGDVEAAASAMTEVLVIKEKVVGLDRLVTSQLDEIKTTLRRLEARSFAVAKPVRRDQPVA